MFPAPLRLGKKPGLKLADFRIPPVDGVRQHVSCVVTLAISRHHWPIDIVPYRNVFDDLPDLAAFFISKPEADGDMDFIQRMMTEAILFQNIIAFEVDELAEYLVANSAGLPTGKGFRREHFYDFVAPIHLRENVTNSSQQRYRPGPVDPPSYEVGFILKQLKGDATVVEHGTGDKGHGLFIFDDYDQIDRSLAISDLPATYVRGGGKMSIENGSPPSSKLRQWPDQGDTRNKGFCAHCGGLDESRDHNPSKVFLDEPLPGNLPFASSCVSCNAGFSDDEEYLACFLECVIAGDVDPGLLRRSSIATTLANNQRLQREIRASRREVDGQVVWDPDVARVCRIAVKLARGLVDYELNEPQLSDPDHVLIAPLMRMSEIEREAFEGWDADVGCWPEIGSRAFHRVIPTGKIKPEDEFINGWLVVQQDRFRYRVEGSLVRMVLREYLAIEVVWT